MIQHLRSKRESAARGTPAFTDTRKVRSSMPFSIQRRPAEVEERAIPGHWEGDLLRGAKRSSHVVTLVERSSRFVTLIKVSGKDTGTVVATP